jgi:hypothetical protein
LVESEGAACVFPETSGAADSKGAFKGFATFGKGLLWSGLLLLFGALRL